MSNSHPDLLRRQRNVVFTAIQQAGLNTDQFSWIRHGKGFSGSPCPVVQHQPSGHYFLFCTPSGGGNNWLFKCTPGRDMPVDSGLLDEGWPAILRKVRGWSHSLSEELLLPDFWANASAVFKKIDSNYDESVNTPFSEDEVFQLSKQVKELQERIVEHALEKGASETDVKYIESSVSHVVDLARAGMGRIDWRNQLIGLLLNLGLYLGLNPEVAIGLFGQAQALFNEFIAQLP